MGLDRFKPTFDNKHKAGETVFANESPNTPLVIRRYVHRVYYCKTVDAPDNAESVYYERELRKAPEKL